jgi:hypothetical protein
VPSPQAFTGLKFTESVKKIDICFREKVWLKLFGQQEVMFEVNVFVCRKLRVVFSFYSWSWIGFSAQRQKTKTKKLFLLSRGLLVY